MTPRISVISRHDAPILTVETPDAAGIRYGFEGGCTLKRDGVYHLFTSEMAGEPRWTRMRLGHWTSADRLTWRRAATLYESSGDYTGADPRACLWSPMPAYDEAEGRWSLTYVAYRSAPPELDRNGLKRSDRNYDGRIWRAVSTVPGPGGLGGPYRDVGVILAPDAGSQPWEGLQGVDSFFPYRAGDGWLAFYGSASIEQPVCPFWGVGLAAAPALAGPWTRLAQGNPLGFEPRFVENPVVARLADDLLIAVYDTGINHTGALGWAWSADGLDWTRGEPIAVQPEPGTGWAALLRTPLGLILEDDGAWTLFYTAYQRAPGLADGDPRIWGQPCAMGLVTLRIEHEERKRL